MNSNTRPIIGLISGIGPLAGADVYHKLLAYASSKYHARADSDYPDVLLLNHGIATVDYTGALSPSFKNELCDMVSRLQTSGASIIGIACNTAHIYHKDLPIQPLSTTVHLLDSVAQRVAATNGPRLMLSSKTTRRKGLYDPFLEHHGAQCDTLPSTLQHTVDTVIEHVMAYQIAEATLLLDTVLAYALVNNYRVLVAGCTELPIALAHSALAAHFTVIDSNQVLAQILVDAYYAVLS